MILAKIPYLNTAPYFHFLSERWLKRHVLVNATPRQLGEMAREGKLDAGVFSLVDAASLVEGGDFEYLGQLGIAGKGPIQSILLFGAEKPQDLEGKAIAVTSHTATTVRLMDLWLREKIGLKSYRKVGPAEPAQAALLIGDQALSRALRTSSTEPRPIDLCEAWTAWTGLPFVFARWAVRKSLPEAEKRELHFSLLAAVELALDDLEAVAGRGAEDTAFQADFIQAYLRGISYKLGDEELEGAALFLEKSRALTGP